MNLEQLVPPLELCQQIPEGAFADSAAVFVTTWACPDDPFVATREEADANGFDVVCCAPTLQEILEALPTRIERPMERFLVLYDTRNKRGTFQIGYTGVITGNDPRFREQDPNPVTAALKLWMEVTK